MANRSWFAGTGIFTVGSESIRAAEGQIVIVPTNTLHELTDARPGLLETIEIHDNGTFVTEWLE